jgi:hypothetical protein
MMRTATTRTATAEEQHEQQQQHCVSHTALFQHAQGTEGSLGNSNGDVRPLAQHEQGDRLE